jgi:hypothetical protein
MCWATEKDTIKVKSMADKSVLPETSHPANIFLNATFPEEVMTVKLPVVSVLVNNNGGLFEPKPFTEF